MSGQVGGEDAAVAKRDPRGAPESARDGPHDHALLSTQWLARVRLGDERGLRTEDVEELFAAVSAGTCSKTVEVTDLCDAVTRYCPPPIGRRMQEVLLVAEPPARRRIDVDGFLQAFRLGASDAALALETNAGDPQATAGARSLDRSLLSDFLRERRAVWDGCRSLPLGFACFALCLAISVYHAQHKSIFQVTEAVRRELPLTNLESNYPSALADWLDSRAEAPDIARYSRLVGGVRVRRLASNEDALAPTVLCQRTVADRLLSGLGSARAAPKICGESAGTISGFNGDSQWILWPLQRGDVHVAASLAQVQGWWGDQAASGNRTSREQAEHLQVSLLAHNDRVQLFVLCWLTFRVSSSGVAKLSTSMTAFSSEQSWSTDDWTMIQGFDSLFIITCAALALGRLVHLAMSLKAHGVAKGLRSHATPVTLIDWIIVGSCAAAVVTYVDGARITRELQQLTGKLPAHTGSFSEARYSAGELQALIAEQGLLQGWSEYIRSLDAATDLAVIASLASKTIRCISVVVSTAACFRLLCLLRAFHRISLLLHAAREAAVGFVRWLLISASALLLVGAMLHAMFAAQLEVFATLGAAVQSAVLLMFGFAPVGHAGPNRRFELGRAVADWRAVVRASSGHACVAAVLSVTGIFLVGFVVALALEPYVEESAPRGNRNLTLPRQLREMIFERRRHLQRLHALASKHVPAADPGEERDCGSGGDGEAALPAAGDGGPLAIKAGLKRARARWSEARVLQALVGTQAHGPVTLDGLIKELEESMGASIFMYERLQLQALLEMAAEQDLAMSAAREATRATSLRLGGRADTQVRELHAAVCHVETCLRQRAEERAMIFASLGEDIKNEVLAAPGVADAAGSLAAETPPPTWVRSGVIGPESVDRKMQRTPEPVPPMEGPEPEPPVDGSTASPEHAAALRAEALATAGEAAALVMLVDEQLHSVASRSGGRYRLLEESLQRFGSCLDPLSRSFGGARGTLDPARLSKLEGLTRELSRQLEPLLGMDGIEEMPGTELRQTKLR